MKTIKKMILVVGAAVGAAMVIAMPALAGEALPLPASAPEFVGTAIGVLVAVAGLIAQADAQITEEFKKRWPWWLVVFWDFFAGNYKHSKNAGM